MLKWLVDIKAAKEKMLEKKFKNIFFEQNFKMEKNISKLQKNLNQKIN